MSRWALRLSSFFSGLIFYAPVALLLRTSKGVTESQFFLLQAMLSIWVFLFEIPTSFFSDRIGHKNCLILSYVLSSLCKIIFLFACNFFLFALESIIEGVSITLNSGTHDAYIYNIFGKSEYGYMKERSLITSFDSAGFLISTALFPFLNNMTDINGLIMLTLAASLMSLFLFTFSPKEKEISVGEKKERIGIKNVFKQLNGPMGMILIINSLFSFTFVVVNFMYVEKLFAVGISVEMISPVIIMYTCLGFMHPVIARIINKKNKTFLYFLCSFCSFVLFLFLGLPINNSIIIIGSMVLIPFLSGVTSMIQADVENRYIDNLELSSVRATALSVVSMGSNLLEILLLIASSFLVDIGVEFSFYISSVMFLFISVIGTDFCRKSLKL